MANGDDKIQVQRDDGTIGSIPRAQLSAAIKSGKYSVYNPPGKEETRLKEAGAPWEKLTSGAGFGPGNILSNIGEAGKGMITAIPQMIRHPIDSIWQPMQQEKKLADEQIARGDKLSGYTHAALSGIPLVGPLVGSLGEQAATGDIGGAAAKGATYYLGGKAFDPLAKAAKGVPEFITKGQEGAAIKAVGRLDGAAEYVKPQIQKAIENVGTEVGAHAQAIIKADEAATAITGKPAIPISNVLRAYDKSANVLRQASQSMPKLDKVLKQLDAAGVSQAPNMRASFEMVKQLRTDIGDAMSAAREAGKSGEASILGSMYKDLTDGMKARANELKMSDSFTKYNVLNTKLRNMLDDGPIGKALKADNGLKFFSKLKETGEAAKLDAHLKSLEQYGLDTKAFQRVLKDTESSYKMASGAYQSYMRYLTTRLTIGGLASTVGIPHGFMFGMAAGMIGPKWAAALKELGTPLGKYGKALDELQAKRSLEGPTKPGTPTLPTPQAPAPKAAPAPTAPATPKTVPLEAKVPVELQPTPGEQPMLNMLLSVIKETADPTEKIEAMKKLTEELKAQAEKRRTKARTSEAMQQYKTP